ncbi:hypothetical protein BATDEDRAFT_84588 [Batrachochytrium dendrobatidis JAM81]|uniref:Uncharacterized protein n=2 Tax=Batrachochytrium dendrobatidis TaxID=109871 RepID=F4NSV3_BATDJ|nr:uncharacterized protein BATDEDRAFT_84588 [Batrachochytrium dendrobatidis JAM81]EGF83858.1 hypothetical protein BATDEDRAFT_84588 [Batrachochytrium dendrobatidis JAM81]OAJ36083.1 hypothetical protein BDEG_20295 [Batrachochytrium dendrobatidis JEL423]|eukprot:XP_006676247.1 hypothetical protein BATDEDRAFT_84588 [Batrachochytrium dendrobatidis JAM81]
MPNLSVGACCEHRAGFLGFAEASALAASSSDVGSFVPASCPNSYAPNLVIEPIHLDIALDFHLSKQTVHAVVTQTFANRHDANHQPGDKSLLKTIRLNAIGFIDLEVSEMEDHGLTHCYDNDTLSLAWAVPFGAQEERKVTFKYTIHKPISGLYFDVPNNAYSAFPNRVAHAITDHETERARYWLPLVDFPAARTTLSFALTAPQEYLAYANGAFQGELVNASNGTRTTRYALSTPCPSYLICVGVGDFVTVDDETVNGIPIKYIAPRGFSEKDLMRTFGRTPAMIRWLEKKLDYPFPWPKYYQICSKFIGGAMENISFVTWLDRYIQDEKLATEISHHIDGVNIHEMAHTYFGDLLVIRHFEHVWLKESWATYVECLWLEDNATQDEFRYEMWWKADRYIAETESYMRPIVNRQFDSSWRMFDGHTYPGGGCRLHVLRKHVGDDAFFKGVQNYLKQYSGKTVETDDFRKCIEAQSGINLVPFFDQWLYSKGYPALKGSFDFKPASVSDSGCSTVSITLEQTQVDVSAKIPFFNIVIDVEVVDTEDKIHTSQVVFNDSTQKKAFAVLSLGTNAKTKPKTIRFDPHGRILFTLDMNPGLDILAKTAADAGDVSNRIWAYRELIKMGSSAALRKVCASVATEKFYGVRIQVAAALAKAKTAASLELLAQVLTNEKDPKAMFFIAARCTARDLNLRNALRLFVERKDIGPRSKAEAFTALGAQRHPDDVQYLLSVAQDPNQIGMHSMIRSGVLRGLGEMRDPSVFAYLVSRTAAGIEPENSRTEVYTALSRVAPWQTQQFIRATIELFEEGLRDESVHVRFRCARGLVTLDSKSSAGAILGLQAGIDERDFTSIKALVKRLRETTGYGPGVSADKIKEFTSLAESLENRLKKMEEGERLREMREEMVKEAKQAEQDKEAAATKQ